MQIRVLNVLVFQRFSTGVLIKILVQPLTLAHLFLISQGHWLYLLRDAGRTAVVCGTLGGRPVDLHLQDARHADGAHVARNRAAPALPLVHRPPLARLAQVGLPPLHPPNRTPVPYSWVVNCCLAYLCVR